MLKFIIPVALIPSTALALCPEPDKGTPEWVRQFQISNSYSDVTKRQQNNVGMAELLAECDPSEENTALVQKLSAEMSKYPHTENFCEIPEEFREPESHESGNYLWYTMTEQEKLRGNLIKLYIKCNNKKDQ